MSDIVKLATAYAFPERLTEAEQQEMMAFAERVVAEGPVGPLQPAEQLLQLLSEQLPPPEGQHGLVLRQGRISISLRVSEGSSRAVFLDPEDLLKSPQELVTLIVEALASEETA